MLKHNYFPRKQGLYDPKYEHDGCGVGFICNIKDMASNDIVKQGLEILKRLEHRGAVGADPKTGDGAGILIQMPHIFFKKIAQENKINLPLNGNYGTGLVFLPKDKKEQKYCESLLINTIEKEKMIFLGWRDVPLDNSVIGKTARETEPVIKQIFISKGDFNTGLEFERKLFLVRRISELRIKKSDLKQKKYFYITNLSSLTFSYKGLLMTDQVERFFKDLQDKDITSSIAIVHSRYSTNTFPTWDLAQPFRMLAHNGEINTLRGNINWIKAKESLMQNQVWGNDIKKILPILTEDASDSAILDNALELLYLSGRSLVHSLMMLVPSAWENNHLMDKAHKDFYKYHACLIEPWDGPAALAVTDGVCIAACLDRNGLRPARYIITNDDRVMMASELGVLDFAYENIKYSGKLEPGKILFIDTKLGKIINDKEIKDYVSSLLPYGDWINQNMIDFENISESKNKQEKTQDLIKVMKSFGYTREDIKVIIKPMADEGLEPTGSMGNDTPHAILSKKSQMLYTYFKQLFAQVTNPAIDPIREEIVMSLDSFIGPQKNILEATGMHCHKIHIKHPILTNKEYMKLRDINEKNFKTKVISILVNVRDDICFNKALNIICELAEDAINKGYTFIALSDRGVCKDKIALPSLLAVSGVHQYLVKKSIRSQISIILESGEPRETHHFALLFGYGVDCVNPYLVYELIDKLVIDKELISDSKTSIKNYIKAVQKGLLKVLSKIGISTLQSYRGSQIYEALGIGKEIINKCFTGTSSRIGGINFDILTKETLLRHIDSFKDEKEINSIYTLNTGGYYFYKKHGEKHLWNPDTISALQDCVRKQDYSRYKEFTKLINNQEDQPVTLRSLLKLKKASCININEVESSENIFKRLVTGAMSFGSISKGAHESLAIAMNRIGARSNTGEGGEDISRFIPMPNGDSKRSAIKQVASGRFGVTTNYLVNADEIQIKIAQGAKPGEGGQLPGHKVSAIIAKTRYTTPGVTLISPPPHHDIYSIEDLAELIYDLKNVNPLARISVKLVSEIGVGTIAVGVAKGHADMILISGADGGTGASPLSSIKHAGLPWELGLSEAHQVLVLNDLRSRVRLQTDGQFRTGYDVVIASLLGAEEYGFCTTALVIMGCVMLRHCHLNNCLLGVATQDEVLQNKFAGRPEYLVTFFKFLAEDIREIMASLGIKKIDDMIGRSDLLEVDEKKIPWKAKHIDFSKILYKPEVKDRSILYCTKKQNHNINEVLDKKLIETAEPSIKEFKKVKACFKIENINRATGAMLSGEICKKYGDEGLALDTIDFKFDGVAGQSFGAFLANGITFTLEGFANDYVGKGISGGKIIIYPNKKCKYKPDENIIMGNTSFYGAIRGEAYINGRAGERFCIRNSGLNAVVEGIGDHGCEYMTGGRVVVLGKTGYNFGAGMSGGIAYIYDINNNFKDKCNLSMVELENVDKEDIETINTLINNHVKYTDSFIGKKILNNFKNEINKFVKVIPIEYKKVLGLK